MAKGAPNPDAPLPTAKTALSAAKYNDVVESAELQAVQVSKVSLDVSPEFYDEASEKKFAFDRELIGVTFKPEGGAVAATFRFTVTVKQKRTRVLKASAEYFVLYEIHEGASRPEAEAFCRRVGVFAAYPYFRALMAQLSWEANAQLPIMPVIATRAMPVKVLGPED